jgi:ubiquitin C-terminal hydrolase
MPQEQQKNYLTGSPSAALITVFEIIQGSIKDPEVKVIPESVPNAFYNGIIDPLIIKKMGDDPKNPDNLRKQQDAQELLNILLEHLTGKAENGTKDITKEAKNVKDIKDAFQPKIQALFSFITETITTCKKDNATPEIKSKLEHAEILSLAIPEDAVTLNDCLKHYTEEEKLETNLATCTGTGATSYIQRKLQQPLPDIIIVQLKLFSYDISGGHKIMREIAIPDPCDFGLYTNQPDKAARYTLNSVIVQHGDTLSGGHYVAYAQSNNAWYLCNDSGITKERPLFLTDTSWQARDNGRPYILFYQRLPEKEIVTNVMQATEVVIFNHALEQLNNDLVALALGIH